MDTFNDANHLVLRDPEDSHPQVLNLGAPPPSRPAFVSSAGPHGVVDPIPNQLLALADQVSNFYMNLSPAQAQRLLVDLQEIHSDVKEGKIQVHAKSLDTVTINATALEGYLKVAVLGGKDTKMVKDQIAALWDIWRKRNMKVDPVRDDYRARVWGKESVLWMKEILCLAHGV
ncbi:uncharacterized protein J4E87_009320 [Alternaria ethzedia]|uniref:uncharacterized protein n=1 Tax=Alternaria ethzedia TaxID=181014 RepID=UPI0020C25859|nr:uncharacterized protein J4E87_009320 [Alternaria ethzedia]KAI4614725.1 hypothetical protein J4E87_009320 [Alternaria ethzedia]